ncbi:MAG: hypothetical protein NXY57DRAFT_948838 [Lentinula lateritia]|nr:MAG: hypothetical protein NXY57DRAFT_948838 [Lentinula lateritia]
MSQDAAEQNIQMWNVKKLIQSLDSARGYVGQDYFDILFIFVHQSFFYTFTSVTSTSTRGCHHLSTALFLRIGTSQNTHGYNPLAAFHTAPGRHSSYISCFVSRLSHTQSHTAPSLAPSLQGSLSFFLPR